MALSLSCRGQAWQHRRFPAAPRSRYLCGAGLLSQGARLDAPARTAQGDAGRPRAKPSRALAFAPRASVLAEREGADQQVLDLYKLGGPPSDQAALRVDGG